MNWRDQAKPRVLSRVAPEDSLISRNGRHVEVSPVDFVCPCGTTFREKDSIGSSFGLCQVCWEYSSAREWWGMLEQSKVEVDKCWGCGFPRDGRYHDCASSLKAENRKLRTQLDICGFLFLAGLLGAALAWWTR